MNPSLPPLSVLEDKSDGETAADSYAHLRSSVLGILAGCVGLIITLMAVHGHARFVHTGGYSQSLWAQSGLQSCTKEEQQDEVRP